MKYSFDGKARLLSLGTYPDTGLKAVRDKRDHARSLVAQGVDPSTARKAEKASRSEAVVNSFEAVAREWHAIIHLGQVSGGDAARTLIRLEQDVFPWLGGLPAGEIKAPQLLQEMRRNEARGAIETAHRTSQACGQSSQRALILGPAAFDRAQIVFRTRNGSTGMPDGRSSAWTAFSKSSPVIAGDQCHRDRVATPLRQSPAADTRLLRNRWTSPWESYRPAADHLE